MENNFDFAEERERYALKQVIDRFTEDNNFTYEVKFNPPGNMNNYDLLILKYKDGKIVKRYLIESKIRFKEYDTYIIECKKIRAIKGIIKELHIENEAEIIYINFTPTKTLYWNITEMERIGKLPVTKFLMPKTTMGNKPKVPKFNIELDTNMATKLDYIFSEKNYNQYLKDNKSIKIEDKIQLNDIFGFLNKKITK